MNLPLRWTLALTAVGVLGFAAGRYLDRDSHSPPDPVTLPVVASAGSPPSSSLQTTRGLPRQVPGSIREILKLPGDFAQTTALYVLAASKDQAGIERLLEEAKTIDRRSEGRAAASILYERYAEIDPKAALEHMMRGDAGFDPSWLYGVFHSWARTDLDAAVAGASKLDDRSRQMAGVAIVRSRDDLTAEKRDELGSKMELQVAVRDPSSFDLRSPKAAARAWQSAVAITDREARMGELYRLTENWARQDPRAAIRAIESLESRGAAGSVDPDRVERMGGKGFRCGP